MLLRQGDPWPDLFRQCQREAFHLELKDVYAEPHESEPLRRFLDGKPDTSDPSPEWRALVRETTGRGVAMSRIRVVTVPLTDYQRWLLSVTKYNVDAGDDIRYIPRHLVESDEMPTDDWWLFDGRLVVFNVSDEDGKPREPVSTIDPGIAGYCRAVKLRLWELATPYSEFRSVHADQ
ncbi:DUF6879 family protein [Nocardia anaemiae]|uniref:DUF6879 family protein n=1 Tax=Nocardia anaemiae TaxID=263910 RepID=UPI0007A481D8|nr:DUF6879 family protein [Nocardia anaemiae]